jgi:hypothetical protein
VLAGGCDSEQTKVLNLRRKIVVFEMEKELEVYSDRPTAVQTAAIY